uniref:Uncharacterized protein n=1 Tax=Oncorhynchus kisutch TaxID=8019 RepID=A0A8C7HF08_ONCKI
ITLIVTLTVPDRCGLPPSTAVTSNLLCSDCFSLSKGFCKTKKGILSSPLSLICKSKCSL